MGNTLDVPTVHDTHFIESTLRTLEERRLGAYSQGTEYHAPCTCPSARDEMLTGSAPRRHTARRASAAGALPRRSVRRWSRWRRRGACQGAASTSRRPRHRSGGCSDPPWIRIISEQPAVELQCQQRGRTQHQSHDRSQNQRAAAVNDPIPATPVRGTAPASSGTPVSPGTPNAVGRGYSPRRARRAR